MVDIESFDGCYICFWWCGFDGDAIVENGKVRDAQINRMGVDLNRGTQLEIVR